MICFKLTITQVGEGPEPKVCIEQHCLPQEATQSEQEISPLVAEGIRQTMEQIEAMLRSGGKVQSVSGPAAIVDPVIKNMKLEPGSQGRGLECN